MPIQAVDFQSNMTGEGGLQGVGVYPITPTLMPTWVSHKMYNSQESERANLEALSDDSKTQISVSLL